MGERGKGGVDGYHVTGMWQCLKLVSALVLVKSDSRSTSLSFPCPLNLYIPLFLLSKGNL